MILISDFLGRCHGFCETSRSFYEVLVARGRSLVARARIVDFHEVLKTVGCILVETSSCGSGSSGGRNSKVR